MGIRNTEYSPRVGVSYDGTEVVDVFHFSALLWRSCDTFIVVFLVM